MKSFTASFVGVTVAILMSGDVAAVFAQPAASTTAGEQAADRVWLEPSRPSDSQSEWYPQPILQRTGTIKRLDRESLSLLVTGDEVESIIAAERVLWIEPAGQSAAETAALRQFADGEYAKSLRPLLDVLEERPPVWRQQWLSMLAAYAAWKSSRDAIALELVSQLDKRPLPPLVSAWLPIAWLPPKGRGGIATSTTVESAAARLTDDSAAVRLVAASWLLRGNMRMQATEVLQGLSTDRERPAVAQLAECLLWRVATPPQVNELSKSWAQKLDALPMVLQAGPARTLAHKLRSAGQTEAAGYLEASSKLVPTHPHPVITLP